MYDRLTAALADLKYKVIDPSDALGQAPRKGKVTAFVEDAGVNTDYSFEPALFTIVLAVSKNDKQHNLVAERQKVMRAQSLQDLVLFGNPTPIEENDAVFNTSVLLTTIPAEEI